MTDNLIIINAMEQHLNKLKNWHRYFKLIYEKELENEDLLCVFKCDYTLYEVEQLHFKLIRKIYLYKTIIKKLKKNMV